MKTVAGCLQHLSWFSLDVSWRFSLRLPSSLASRLFLSFLFAYEAFPGTLSLVTWREQTDWKLHFRWRKAPHLRSDGFPAGFCSWLFFCEFDSPDCTLLSPQVRHLYICDFHKNFIQSVRNKRKRKTSDDGGESPDHDVEVPEVRARPRCGQSGSAPQIHLLCLWGVSVLSADKLGSDHRWVLLKMLLLQFLCLCRVDFELLFLCLWWEVFIAW